MNSVKYIAVDVDDRGIGIAEFACPSVGAPRLLACISVRFDAESLSGMALDARIAITLKRLLGELRPSARNVRVGLGGHAIFSRLVELPPVAPDKLLQTVRHEAVQNIPFPIDEVIWNHQMVEGAATDEIVLFAAKSDLVAGVVRAVVAAGLSLETIESGSAVFANAVRYGYPELIEPALVVELREQATNLIFIDGPRTFFRTFALLDGKTERLIQEITRSIGFYCSQQKGNAPQRILLAGDASEIEIRTQLLHEHLKLPVICFDPFRWVDAGDDLARAAVSRFGVLVGFVVPERVPGGIYASLMPESLQHSRRFRGYVVAGLAVLLCVLASWSAGLMYMTRLIEQESRAVQARIAKLEPIDGRLEGFRRRTAVLEHRGGVYLNALDRRTRWVEVLEELRLLVPDGMFLLESESLHGVDGPIGMRISVLSYLDKEDAGQDAVGLFCETLRASSMFSDQTKVVKRPTKQLFARSFVIDVFFEEYCRL